MGALPNGISTADVETAHKDLLNRVCGAGAHLTKLLHSYKRSLNGFSAILTEEEARVMREMEGVVSVFLDKSKKLYTTRSWDFVSFPADAQRLPSSESEIIVGMMDTGIWPDSKSFDDTGLGPPPSKWKGTCQTGENFTCNNKIIGARFYHSGRNMSVGDVLSPLDSKGHGSHTASTVAGRQVIGASVYGLARGIARGAVPSARIAVYKVCWSDQYCSESDILAAFDDAIADGVDIISASLGGPAVAYFEDANAIGVFHAMRKGILTSLSAGNQGPNRGTVTNIAPWQLTVAANTIDRRFIADVRLGSGKIYEGVAINTFDLKGKMYPLSPNCSTGLNPTLVGGRIFLCSHPNSENTVSDSGVVGVISESRYTDNAGITTLPETALGPDNASAVRSYARDESDPTATITKTIVVKNPEAPVVVSFSSRGPNTISEILKPDLTAPGVDILAAWSLLTSMSGNDGDSRIVEYNIISGTSMSCPHVSGAAAFVKEFRPNWSPAAIKSALMTTAFPMRRSFTPEAELAYGAGQINPLEAVYPGLTYDMSSEDYVRFLCGEGYSTKNLRLITGDKSACPPRTAKNVWDLNYPSFALTFSGKPVSKSFYRTVTNVGRSNSTYKAVVTAPPELRVVVIPEILSFAEVEDKQSFVVEVSVVSPTDKDVVSASLIWSDGVHQVRSPIVVYLPHFN